MKSDSTSLEQSQMNKTSTFKVKQFHAYTQDKTSQ
jgi:hypothetical protein